MKLIEIYKIIFCPDNKKYKIIFRTLDSNREFLIYFDHRYAKNIAMASENIVSVSLSQYELFLNLLNELKLTIKKVLITNENNILNSIIYLADKKNNFIEINSFIGDAIILSLKTFSDIYINEKFLLDAFENESYTDNSVLESIKEPQETTLRLVNLENKESLHSKMSKLELALKQCIDKENYESAAFIRDRINSLKNQ